MLKNSGGEKFVVYFSVLSALMAYTRSRTLEAAGADEDKDSSVELNSYQWTLLMAHY